MLDFFKDEMKKEAILKSLKLFFGPEAEHPLDFFIKVLKNVYLFYSFQTHCHWMSEQTSKFGGGPAKTPGTPTREVP